HDDRRGARGDGVAVRRRRAPRGGRRRRGARRRLGLRGGAVSEAPGRPLRVLILQHEDPTPPGLVTEWLDRHGAEVEVFRIDLEDREVDPSRYDLIVSLGSEFAAYDDSHEFVRREAPLMRRAVDADVPV